LENYQGKFYIAYVLYSYSFQKCKKREVIQVVKFEPPSNVVKNTEIKIVNGEREREKEREREIERERAAKHTRR
jgi:hypothetical protein